MNTNFIFATNNPNKLKEVRHIANNKFNIVGIDEFGITEELPETQNTLEGNALQKARYLYEKISKNCFADDTGLEVEALNGRPGIFSARYAGEEKSSIDNIKKLLNELKDCSNRSAQFRTVVALILNGKEYLFEGIIKGKIIGELKGENGFGYDPVFVPLGFEKTFAELPLNIKNTISHIEKAFKKLFNFLKHYKVDLK